VTPLRLPYLRALTLLVASVMAASLLLLLIGPGLSPAHAATTITVNSSADPGDGICDATECTLREAIDAAATGDTIIFSPTLNGSTITLSSFGSLDIMNDLTIDGSNNAITISGDHSTQVFCVCPGAQLALKNLTVAEGDDISDIGGGIYNGGTLEVTNSTFSGNSAGDSGGAIYNNGGTLEVTNSTFSNNSAINDGGGIFNGSGGTATLRNTIVANSPSGGNCFNDGGTLNDDGYNMDDDGTCVDPSVTTSKTVADAKLGPLQNNGGPTFTHALLPTSPALNAIPPAGGCGVGITTDQRGVTRPQGTGCDIGAFELVVTPPPPPPPSPVARPDLFKINQATLLIVASPGLLKNDTGPSPLSAQLVSRPKHGTLKLNPSGSLAYQPTANFAGIDTFTYRAKSGTSVSNIAKVTIKINKKKP
jgi:CSLREA domain-containing protein